MDSIISSLLTILSTLTTFALLIYLCYHQILKNGTANKNQSPPRAGSALPIIGHLHLFGGKQLLHETLSSMAEKYGPIFTIRLGSQETLVVSSWETAKECFTTHDKAFSDRPKITATRVLGYDSAMFGLAPYGLYWREMRKIATVELLTHRRIDMLSNIFISEMHVSLKELYYSWVENKNPESGLVVDMKQWFGDLTFNTSVRMVGGKRLLGRVDQGDGEEGKAMRKHQKTLMKDFIYFFGVFNLSDAIPSLGWLDFQGTEKTMKRIAKELDELLQEWLDEHKERRMALGDEREDQDFMDVLLNILEGSDDVPPAGFDADTINKATCLNILLAGSDSTMVTLTWALALLLNNPIALKKVQDEVDTYVSNDRHVEISDIKNLVYLHAVIKETLRLYPPTPIIGLHSAMEDCTFSSGYCVPSGTRLMVNAWKIQRDGRTWPDPNEFRPERFLTSHKDVDVRGQSFELIPFGSGRRSCPGTSLGLQMVHFTLASVIHCYEISTISGAEMDMTESPGFTNVKATPLDVYFTPRVRLDIFGA